MGLCLCTELIDDDYELAKIQKIEREMKVLRNKMKARNMPIIWLEGTPGSGKQTHACNIAERFNYGHVQVENVIKEDSEKDTRRGRYSRSKLTAGKKLPDRLIVEVIKEAIIQQPDCNGFLISGFPQTPKQATLFVKEIAPVDCILYLDGEQGDAVFERRGGDQNLEGLRKDELGKEGKVMVGKYDSLLERINANEPAADVFLKIEAAILDRTTVTS